MRKTTFEFTLILDGVREITSETEDALFEAGCDDALLGRRNGTVYLDFTRKTATLIDGVIKAIRQVENSGINARVIGVEPSPFVSVADLSRKVLRTKESIRLLAEGKRGSGTFPPAKMGLKSTSPLWELGDVLRSYDFENVADTAAQEADTLYNLFLALEIRAHRDSWSEIFSILEQLGEDVASITKEVRGRHGDLLPNERNDS